MAIEEVRRRVLKLANARKPAPNKQEAVEKVEAEIANLTDAIAASVNIDRARAEMRKLIGGEIQVNATADEIRLEAKQGVIDAALLRAAGQRQVLMVAGASFVCRFRPIELRKDHSRYPKCSKRHGREQA
jgi:hypothetical protein